MQFIKRISLLAAPLLLCMAVYSQDVSFITKMSELDKKVTATYGDALLVFRELGGKEITLNYKDDQPLTRGMAALMTARYLNLNDSLMYNLFGTERYAFQACVAAGLMREDGSENDLMSGTEFLALMSSISARSGE